ncbi:MAG: aldehyde ferredoxin oxidoreductase family protein [Syntrophobacteraceae bacterium]|jgi:aldehyde:ferredoxin oxidoreductase
MRGFYNRVLSVDMTQRSFDVKTFPDEVMEKFLGGKGLATYMLLCSNPVGVDPLSKDNRLIFAIGPATGTGVWGSCRYGVFTKSPQTGFYSESYSGGSVAEYMAGAGFDAFIIEGGSDVPVWVEITEDEVFFHPAADLWGLETYETEDKVREWIKRNRPGSPQSGVVVIGPAGENLVRFAVIENNYWRSAGRTGVGAVMGSKKIKAVAFRGNRRKELADPGLINRFVKEMSAVGKENAGVRAYKSMGTPMLVDILNEAGGFPTRYWKKGRSEYRESFNASALLARADVKPRSCPRCFMACGKVASVKEGRHKGLKIEGPEYETIFAFGGLCEVNGIEEIMHLNDLCDRLGMDTISAGNLAAFTIEAARQGRIDAALDYGDVDAIARLLSDIAYNRGHGAVLSRGIKHAARLWGMEDQAIHVKGLEPPGYDPRILKGMGLAYGSSARGACHLRATFYKPELAGMIPRDQIDGKAAMFAEWEDRLLIFDTLILCRFYRDLYQWDKLREIIRGTTGLDLDAEEMRKKASAVIDNTRRFNIREGLTKKDDYLPKRFLTEALPETGNVITEEQMVQLLQDYYRVRGWDEEGVPAAHCD